MLSKPPETSGELAEHFRELPDCSKEFSGHFREFPGHSGELSHHSREPPGTSVELPDHFREFPEMIRELGEMSGELSRQIPKLAKECKVYCRKLAKLLLSAHQLTGLSAVLVSIIYMPVKYMLKLPAGSLLLSQRLRVHAHKFLQIAHYSGQPQLFSLICKRYVHFVLPCYS